ncbi:MAG: hypothetical protein SGI71_11940 [Verrucomicrobiota bacterium]|nr:hypothetical protein [Verrucomicrobiota bacterium]
MGCSSRSLFNLGISKGYQLYAATHTNLIFVLAESAEKAGLTPVDLEEVLPLDGLTYVVSSYNGQPFLLPLQTEVAPRESAVFVNSAGFDGICRQILPNDHRPVPGARPMILVTGKIMKVSAIFYKILRKIEMITGR